MNHVTIGVYENNSFVVNIVAEEDLQDHIEYNQKLRPGRYLFVDGKYNCGGIKKETQKNEFIKVWEEKISQMNINSSRVSEKYY